MSDFYYRRYHARKAQGICPRCGNRPPVTGKVYCLECITYTMALKDRYTKEGREKREREMLVELQKKYPEMRERRRKFKRKGGTA